MSYSLDNTDIRAPNEMEETKLEQATENQVLVGNISRKNIGSVKRRWSLSYRNVNPEDYTVIANVYDSYLGDAETKTFEITEGEYTVGSANVHVDLISREISAPGTSFVSDFDLILTEA